MPLVPTKEDIILKEWQQAYIHFALRLKQRYSMEISFEEYKELAKSPLPLPMKINNNKQVGFIEIRGKQILVVRDRRYKRIVTALPINSKKHKL